MTDDKGENEPAEWHVLSDDNDMLFAFVDDLHIAEV